MTVMVSSAAASTTTISGCRWSLSSASAVTPIVRWTISWHRWTIYCEIRRALRSSYAPGWVWTRIFKGIPHIHPSGAADPESCEMHIATDGCESNAVPVSGLLVPPVMLDGAGESRRYAREGVVASGVHYGRVR